MEIPKEKQKGLTPLGVKIFESLGLTYPVKDKKKMLRTELFGNQEIVFEAQESGAKTKRRRLNQELLLMLQKIGRQER